MSTQEKDLSVRTSPPSWRDAQEDSPVKTDNSPLKRTEKVRLMPKGDRVSIFAACIAAMLGGLVGGIGWYLSARWGYVEGPWIAVGLGVLIPVVVRVASSSGDAPIRAGASFAFYLITLLAVLSLLTRDDQLAIYGQIGDFDSFGARFKARYFKDTTQIAAYAVGAIASLQLSFMFKEKGGL